jgi:hypothetical protein
MWRSETAMDGYVKDSLPTSDTNMPFIERNTKKQFKLYIHTRVPSAEIKERVKPIFIYFSSCENNELKSYKFNTL